MTTGTPIILTIDCETSIYEKGSAFVPANKLYCISYGFDNTFDCLPIAYGDRPYAEHLAKIQDMVDNSSCLVGFNIKFDLHWLRRYGISFDKCSIFDCQLAAFILAAQRTPYPSLNDVALRYLDRSKLDVVNNEYWEHGIDTGDIPWDILSEYAIQDVRLTQDLYEHFMKLYGTDEMRKLKRLLSLQCQDLLALEEMEWNGLKFDFEKAKEKELEITGQLNEIREKLSRHFPNTSINWNSGDDVSCVLYGGTIVTGHKLPNGFFKTGDKTGQVRYKWVYEETKMARLVEPLKNSKLKKEGYWSTSEDILRQTKARGKAKDIIALILEAAKLEKLNGTYYNGIAKLADRMGWTDGFIHGQFNQTTVVTSRLSSSKPNLQNMASEVDELLVSRYDSMC